MRIKTKDRPTREEQREELERAIGNWYLVSENGKRHPYVIQYHHRGLWYEKERKEIETKIDQAKEGKEVEELKSYLKKNNVVYLQASEQEIAKSAQKADDERGNVTGAIKKHLTDDPPEKIDKSKIVNSGNVHIDFRILEPDGEYLVSWTFLIPKVVLQYLDGKLFYPLRDRFLSNEEGDQWTVVKKATQPLPWLGIVDKRKPIIEREPGTVGATSETTGIIELKETGYLYFGVQKDDFSEYWLFPERGKGRRIDVKLVPGSKLYRKAPKKEFWMAMYPFRETKPYILTHDRIKEEAKAKKDKIEMIWNEKLIECLRKEKIFKQVEDKEPIHLPYIEFKKFDEELRIAAGPVVIPGKVDRQGQRVNIHQLAKAVYEWAAKKRTLTIKHQEGSLAESQVVPVEIFIFPEKEILNKYPTGTFWLGVKFYDDKLWAAAKRKQIHAFSIGGRSHYRLAKRVS